jgi:hypothetical protein
MNLLWRIIQRYRAQRAFKRGHFSTPVPKPKPPMDRSPSDLIEDILREQITPLLKKHGFRKKGRTYYRPRQNWMDVLNVQSNKWNTSGDGSFTVNLGIFVPEVSRAVHGDDVTGDPHEYDCILRERIGFLGANGKPRLVGQDEWWKFDNATDLTALAEKVARDIETKALNYFERYRTYADMMGDIARGESGIAAVPNAAALAVLMGDKDKAQQLIEKAAQAEQPYANRVRRDRARIAERLGLSLDPPSGEQLVVVSMPIAYSKLTSTEQKYLNRLLDRVLDRLDEGKEYFDRITYSDCVCEIHLYSEDAPALVNKLESPVRSFSKRYCPAAISMKA